MVVFKLSAADMDASNFNISYYLTETSDIFRIDTETGILMVSNVDLLNGSENKIYSLQIEAVDTGSPARTGTCIVQVRTDENCPQNAAAGSNNKTAEIYLAAFYICFYNMYVFHLLFKRNDVR